MITSTRRQFAVFLFVFAILNFSFLTLKLAQAQAAPAVAPKTGQTTSYAARDDGNLERGAAWLGQRFSNNGNGTVTDNLTGLIWLRDANCTDSSGGVVKSSGNLTWANALIWSNTLSSGRCGLSEGSHAGDWRLPNVDELESLVDLEHYSPALPTGHPFNNVQSKDIYGSAYWSSSTDTGYNRAITARGVNIYDGYVNAGSKTNVDYVWPVRSGQVGSFGYSGISFSNLPAQTINTPFDVTISAFDPTGKPITGWVNLSLASGNLIKPNAVYLTNGSGTAQLIFTTPEANARIMASGQGQSGSSAYFAVTDPANPNASGKIVGKVLSKPDKIPLIGVNVVISGKTSSFSKTVTTGAGGFYSSDLIPVGDYNLHAADGTNNGSESSVTVNSGRIQTVSLDLALSQKPPVLIVSGVMGSTKNSTSKNDLYPRMPDGYASAGSLQILDPTVSGSGDKPVGLQALKNELKNDFSIFEVPWDWRMDTEQAVEEYLMPAIRNAMNTTHYGKVNIVAHSQGGLLVRTYIQSSSYRSDVDQLIMVGTPNQGSANPYWMLEGGDPKTIDDIGEEFDGSLFKKSVNFYSHVANRLYKAKKGSNAFKTCSEAHGWNIFRMDACVLTSPYDNLEFDEMKIDKKTMRDFLNANLEGPKKLMASYDGLLSDKSKGIQLNPNLNDWLKRLNSDQEGLNIMTRISDTGSPNKVRTAQLHSTGKKTLRTVDVDTTTTSLYRYGQPRSSQIFTNGDGTVPFDEAHEPLRGYVDSEFRAAEESHAGLLGSFKNEIRNYLLCQKPTTCPSVSTMKTTLRTANVSAAATSPSPTTLSINLDGRVQPYLVDPNGKTNGVNPQTGVFSEDIPTSNTVLNVDSSLIAIDTPSDGVYTLSFKGLSDDVYDLSFIFANETTMETKQFRGVHHNGVTTLTFSVNSAATTKLNVTIPVAPPTFVVATASGGNARLSWTVATDPAVIAYDVYARKSDQPSFTLLGTTATTGYDTAQLWNNDGTKDVWSYLVIARKANGTESFFETVVENRDYLVAGFTADKTRANGPVTVTFTDLSTGTVTGRQWDFDGDGIIDSTEQNPVHTYTADGTYSVALTVTGPNGSDFQTKTGYIILNSTPTIVDALKVLQAVFGITPLTAAEKIRYDVAPLSTNGTPLGNGIIDAADVILLLRRSIGIGSW